VKFGSVRVVALAALAAAAAVAGGGSPRAQPARPNLLLFTLDTVRADRLGSYGYRGAGTPTLDRLAAQGVRFADATTHAPLTGPAHAGILTGRYPARYAIRDNAATPLRPESATLATVLRRAGYRTGAFIGAFVLDRAYGFDQGFEEFDSRFDGFQAGDKRSAERSGAEVAAAAVSWLGRIPADRPFFAWVHLYDAHAPYSPPAPYAARFRTRPYDGEIAAVDAAVGGVLTALQKKGALDQTLIVAIADHGESLGEHGEEDHGVFLYDAVLRIPWLMRLPGGERAGTVVGEQVRAIDLAPTVLDALGVGIPNGLDGESLMGVVRGRPRRDPPPSYAETYYPQLHFGWSPLQSLRVGDWKLIRAPRTELYKPRVDPLERTNLVEGQASVASRLGAELRGVALAWTETPARPASAPDRDTIERLRSLGYVGVTMPTAAGSGLDPKDEMPKLRSFRRLVSGATDDLRLQNPRAAITKLKAALAIFSRAYDVHIQLGDAYMQMKELDAALGEYEMAALLNPASADPLLAQASVRVAQGRPLQALQKMDEADHLEPRSAEVAFARGRLYEQQGRSSEAYQQFRRAVGANPSDMRARARLASSALAAGRLDEAAEQLKVLESARYQPSRTRLLVGQVLEARGDKAGAAAAYRRALELEPGLAGARAGLARLGVKGS